MITGSFPGFPRPLVVISMYIGMTQARRPFQIRRSGVLYRNHIPPYGSRNGFYVDPSSLAFALQKHS